MFDSRDLTPRKDFWFRAALVGVILVGVLLAAELGIRIVQTVGYSTFVFRQYDPQLGTTLIPGVEGTHQRCYDGYVRVNRHGMRDRERTLEKPEGVFRIGIFGDSFTEAVHVKPAETPAALLETRLNQELCDGRCEVLEFSVASYSTVQEYLRYRTQGRRFDLDLVVLVTIGDDLLANVDPLDPQAGSYYHAPYVARFGERFEFVPPRRLPLRTASLTAMARHADLVLYTAKLWQTVRKRLAFVKPAFGDASTYTSDSLRHKADELWQAYDFVLARFAETVRADSAAFVLAFVDQQDAFWWDFPMAQQVQLDAMIADPAHYRHYRLDVPENVFDLGAYIAAYIRTHDLRTPYLSFPCDPHFTPQGLQVVADGLYAFLMEQRAVRLPFRPASDPGTRSTP